ncbi:hypothetical protein F2Q69_00010631 [Brassica cretica]|uniref:Uncharacterized protein n=1 Tax=Brassica cretica TaxID=69181 RepID=A0A8S9QT91_BRACR|nr:hypothetical protein F2Q69_00010631 [Brassica cretica]
MLLLEFSLGSPLTWIIPWTRLGSGPLHPGGLYLGWEQGPTPSTAFDDRMDSSPPPGVEVLLPLASNPGA